MAEYVTKTELEEVLDKKFAGYQQIIVSAISGELSEIKKDVADLRQSVRDLTTTLDNFLKRLTDREEEMKLMQADIAKIKSILKEKLGVEVLL